VREDAPGIVIGDIDVPTSVSDAVGLEGAVEVLFRAGKGAEEVEIPEIDPPRLLEAVVRGIAEVKEVRDTPKLLALVMSVCDPVTVEPP
jgi:hypothetical protein